MDAVMSVISTWKDLIIKVFGQYPLAASLMTLAAVGVWFFLEKTLQPRQPARNTLIAGFGWAIGVPILGGVLWVLGELWELFKAVAGPVADVLSSLFSIYQKHPFLVLILVLLAIGVYFAWKRWRANVLPSRALRILSLAIGVTIVAHLLSPIAAFVSPESRVATRGPEAVGRELPVAPAVVAPAQIIKPTALPVSGAQPPVSSSPSTAGGAVHKDQPVSAKP